MLIHIKNPILVKVRLGDIDLENKFFQIRVTSAGESLPFLRKLVAAGVKLKSGMLRKKESGKFQIIAGFQRITVLLEIYGPDYEVEFWVYDEGFACQEEVNSSEALMEYSQRKACQQLSNLRQDLLSFYHGP